MHNNNEQHILETTSNILTSQTLSDIWTRHHKSKENDNPALDIAKEIQNISQNIEDHPELLLFMQRLIEIELIAIEKPKQHESSDITNFRKYLNDQYSYASNLCEEHNIYDENTTLPKEYEQILEIIEYQTGKTPIRPLHSLWNITKTSANHIAQDAKEHPFLFGSLISVAVGMVYLSSLNADKFATIYIDENVRHATDLGDDFWDDTNDSGDFLDNSFTFDQSITDTIELQASCHQTAIEMGALLAGDAGAEIAKSAPSWMVDLFPEHCTRVKNLASDAIGELQGGFSWVHERLDVVIRDPANNIGEVIAQNTPFQTAFIDAANNSADFWYRLNDIENIAVHTLLTAVTASAVVKYDSLSTEESSEWKKDVSDFFHRTTRNLPLSYILACGGSIYAYMANDGVNPNMIWMGLGGVIAGNTIHKLNRSAKSRDLVEKTTISIKKSMADISDSIKIITDEIIDNNNCNNAPYQYKDWKDYIKKPAIIAVEAASLTALDMAVTNGQISGAIAGGGVVTSQYLMYNVVEDTALHGIFITLGLVIGKSISYTAKAKNYLSSAIRKEI